MNVEVTGVFGFLTPATEIVISVPTATSLNLLTMMLVPYTLHIIMSFSHGTKLVSVEHDGVGVLLRLNSPPNYSWISPF